VLAFVKKEMQRTYSANGNEEHLCMNTVLATMRTKDFSSTIGKCGYRVDGFFDPLRAYNHVIVLENAGKSIEQCLAEDITDDQCPPVL
jgi:hypothetical protein